MDGAAEVMAQRYARAEDQRHGRTRKLSRGVGAVESTITIKEDDLKPITKKELAGRC
jgi:hypothetical protein